MAYFAGPQCVSRCKSRPTVFATISSQRSGLFVFCLAHSYLAHMTCLSRNHFVFVCDRGFEVSYHTHIKAWGIAQVTYILLLQMRFTCKIEEHHTCTTSMSALCLLLREIILSWVVFVAPQNLYMLLSQRPPPQTPHFFSHSEPKCVLVRDGAGAGAKQHS
jgi:hypothetical protein